MIQSQSLEELENLVSENLSGQLKIIERIVKLDGKDAQAFRDWYNNNKTRKGIEEVYAIVGVGSGAMGDPKS
jgi:hypothetical protein